MALGDTTQAGGAVDRCESAIPEQEDAIRDVPYARQLVRRDDDGAAAPLTRGGSPSTRERVRLRPIVPEQQLVADVELSDVAGRAIDESSGETALDAARVGPPKTGEAVKQRRRARAPRAEDRHALAALHVEVGATEHPDASGATRDAGGVALPEGAGTQSQ
jgi:hypothetical protein